MVRGEVWWATTPGGDRPVLVLTRDPVADRIGAVVVAACTSTIRGLTSELPLCPEDGMPTACVATFDNVHTLRRGAFRAPITRLSAAKMADACQVLSRALGCV
jgi:mRNA interferase MazF